MTKPLSFETQREAVRLYRTSKMSLRDVGRRFGVSQTTIERWLRRPASRIPSLSFVPIVVDESDNHSEDAPPAPTPDISVTIRVGTGSTLHLHLHSFDEVAALVRSLEPPC